MQTRQPKQMKQADGNAEVNPAWISFFAEAMRLAELARQRHAAREAEEMNENGNNSEAVTLNSERQT